MKTSELNSTGWLLGAVLCIGSLVVFVVGVLPLTLAGESAHMVTQWGGLYPLRSPEYPLWRWVFQAAWSFPFGRALVGVNALSVVFGAVGIGLLYYVVSVGVRWLVNPGDLSEKQGVLLSRLAGVAAAVGLCFSAPYWSISTRVHNATFDIALLLGAATVLLTYARSRNTAWLYILSFVWGVGTVEYASFIIFAPLVILTVLVLMWQKGHLRVLPVTTTLVCGVLGLSMYLVAAWNFYGSEGYVIREYPSYWKIIWFMWRDQYRLIAQSLPREGWLLVLLTTGVPWLVGLGVARNGLNDEQEWGGYSLHVILSIIVAMVLLNTGIAPWALLGYARLLVLPYVLTAALTGYLVAYWLRQALAWGHVPDGKVRGWVVRVSGIMFTLGLAGVVVAAPFRNRVVVDHSGGEVVNECASLIVDIAAQEGMGSTQQTWLVSDGTIDDLVKIAAYQDDVPLEVLDLSAADDAGYRRYVATRQKSIKLKNLALIGLGPLLEALMTQDKAMTSRVLVFGAPDLWAMAGRVPVPDRLVSRGVEALDDVDLDDVYRQHVAFWDRVTTRLQAACEPRAVGDPVARVAVRLLQQASLMANNLGVCLEDKGVSLDKAFACYTKARELNPDNVSALLNMNRMVDQGFDAANKEELQAALAEITASNRRYDVLMLSRLFGYVRDPQAFSGIARTWALTGQPRLAMQSLQKALDLAGAGQQQGLKTDLAGVYLSEGRTEESEALYYELLVEDPENKRALIGLSRIAAIKGDAREAAVRLDQAAKAGVPPEAIAMERATQRVLQKDDKGARKELEGVISRNSSNLRAWRLLSDILARNGDWEAIETAAERLRTVEGGDGFAAELHAMLALKDSDIVSARKYLDEAITLQPRNQALLDRAMRVSLATRDLNAAEEMARRILAMNLQHPMANYVMGAARLAEGENAMAEEAFHRSLATQRLPEALNDLAWLLFQKGEYAEAEGLAREAVEARPEMYQAWDTLGSILLQQNKLDEAESALQKALSLSSDVGILLHMAQLQAAKGNTTHASEIMQVIADKTDRLSSEAMVDYEHLKRDLGDG